MPKPEVVVFDLGGVLIDWDPRHLYRRLVADAEVVVDPDLVADLTEPAHGMAPDVPGPSDDEDAHRSETPRPD